MIDLPGYENLTYIYESANSQVYRGIRSSDRRPAIIKLLKQDYPTPAELTRYKQEYEIIRNLNIDGAIEAYSLENYQRTLAIILEDFGAESLKILMAKRKFTIIEFLNLAIQITEILGNIHAANVIHKDINPSNIVLNPTTGQLKIIDFGIATLLSRENPTLKNPHLMEGTLPYISPEQTGRMNRSLDYRTDFYSLGVTFYEMLTHKLPFETQDAIELIHCHIAKQPVPPCEVNPEIPLVISNIIMKLLAKNAENRYQSDWGIKADLVLCLMQLEANENIEDITPGENDISDKFQIPQKLYGREVEIETLLAAFARVSSASNERSQIEMLLVAGYSGIGKSALVQEIYKPITEKRGYFITGKFDRFQRYTPYSAVVSALQGLVLQLLAETEHELAGWQQKLLTALGHNGQVIIDVIPEVELIIGKQPPVPELAPQESENRFNLVFENFIRAFCSQSHPLVIFLDDLQWADSASLNLIQLMMADIKTKYLFLIGAYRDNEITSSHQLSIVLNELPKSSSVVHKITLEPLKLEHITRLIADTLHSDRVRVKALAELVMQKTGGNPFFINEFLKNLYSENLISFNFDTLTWQWDIAQIEAKSITGNVVDLMIAKLQKLPAATQEVLRLAACVGADFDLHTIASVCEKPLQLLFADLKPALQSGLILPVSDLNTDLIITEYKFLHDRVQQASYCLIDEAQKQSIHLQIGRLLWQSNSPEVWTENVFKIVDRLNLALDLITSPTERHEIAKLNSIAAKKSKAATAYNSAIAYLTAAIELLGDRGWQEQYELTLKIYLEAVESTYLKADFPEMEKLAEVVLQKAETLLDKVKVYEVKILACQVRGRQLEAISIGLEVLNFLGINFPKSPSQLDIDRRLTETKQNITGKSIEELIDLPVMSDRNQRAALRILASVYPPSFQVAPQLLPLIICEMVNLSLQYGNAPLSAFAYALYGLILCGVVGDIEYGYQFENLSLTLLERFNAKQLEAKIFEIVGVHIRHWKQHFRETFNLLKSGYQSGIENGDVEFAGYCGWNYCSHLYFSGGELKQLESEMKIYSYAISQLKQNNTFNYLETYRQIVLNLIGKSADSCWLVGEAYNEEVMLPELIKAKDNNGLNILYLNKLILCYLFGNYQLAIENAAKAENYLNGATGMLLVPIFYFYDSLARLATYWEVTSIEPAEMLQKVRRNQTKMQDWAHHAPMNYLHKFYLVEAEIQRVLGNNLAAMENYDRAIAGAKENKFLNEEALANELAAKFYLAWGKEKIAKAYMNDAHYCYSQWGAKAKVEYLEKQYPQLITYFKQMRRIPNARNITFSTSTSSSSGEVFDLAAVMKASQAISGEILLDKLLASLMKILIENAGAQTGYLIFPNKGRLSIEAFGDATTATVEVLQSKSIEGYLPVGILNYVFHCKESVVLNDATREGRFTQDPYIIQNQSKSILCAPLLNQGQLTGIVYLENNLSAGAFTDDRLEFLKLLSTQAAISIHNAKLYAEVRESENKLNQLLEAVPVGLLVTDASGKPYFVNSRAQELLTQGLINNTNIERLAEDYKVYLTESEEVYPEEKNPLFLALQGKNANIDDMEIRQADRTIPIEVWGTPIYDEKGQINYAILAFADITERKQAQKLLAEYNQILAKEVAQRTQELSQTLADLQATQQELIQSEKMAALGQLVAGIAHEINTPLGAIRASANNSANALAEVLPQLFQICQRLDIRQQEEFFTLVNRAIHSKLQLTTKEKRQFKRSLTQQLESHALANARNIADTLTDMGIYEEIEPFLPLLRSDAAEFMLELAYNLTQLQSNNKNISIAVERASKIVFALKTYARYDLSGTRQSALITDSIETVLELYRNQLKRGVEVIRDYQPIPPIQCYPDELMQVWTNLIHNALQAMNYQGNLQIKVFSRSQQVAVEFIDNGCGISPEIKERIFEPFFTTKPAGEGSGLGLDIVRKIVTKHSGKIEVESLSGLTTFRVWLPTDLT